MIKKSSLFQEKSNHNNPNSEEYKFIELSEIDPPDVWSEPGENTKPGYYGYFADHPPSDSAKLSDNDSKPTSEELPRIEQLSIVKSDQPKSVDLYRPKLADYRESKQNVLICIMSRSNITFFLKFCDYHS